MKNELKIKNIINKESAINRNKDLMFKLQEGLKNSYELKVMMKESEREEEDVLLELNSRIQTIEGEH